MQRPSIHELRARIPVDPIPHAGPNRLAPAPRSRQAELAALGAPSSPLGHWFGELGMAPDPGANPPAWPWAAGVGQRGDGCPIDVTDAERLLVQRVTFGLTNEELALVSQLGYEGYLEYHLNPEAIDDSEMDRKLRRYPTLQESVRKHYKRAVNGDYSPAEELIFATAWRQAESKRQLYERMVEFWTDHFNIYLFKDGCEYLKPADDRDTIRAYAMDTFPNLLLATARSSAMLTYLDNAGSYVGSPNQNYARELLELHTLGTENYTQFDIEEIARCFTGWTVDYRLLSRDFGTFYFEPSYHDDGGKTVLGYDIPPGGGVTDGQRVLEILSTDPVIAPKTARFVGTKLLRHLWGYEPPQDLIDDVVNAYLSTGGDIKAMIRAALNPDKIGCAAPKLKRPNYLAVSAVRALQASLIAPDYLAYEMYYLGQYPFYWAPPNGYPDSLGYWSGNLLPRWRMGLFFFNEQVGIRFNINDILGAGSADQKIEAINQKLFFGQLPETDRAELLAYLSVDPDDRTRVEETVALALGAPGFQWF